jgi:hypothetical protein
MAGNDVGKRRQPVEGLRTRLQSVERGEQVFSGGVERSFGSAEAADHQGAFEGGYDRVG